MTAKEYLLQAKFLKQRINSKMSQMQQMRDLAITITQVISDMPKAKNASTSRMEDTITDIVDLENEISDDIKDLVALQKEITMMIERLDKLEHKMILTERYIDGSDWCEIADLLHYSVRWTQSLHGEALIALQSVLDSEKTS